MLANKGKHHAADATCTEDDNTPPPLDDVNLKDLSEARDDSGSLSDYGEEDEDVEDLRKTAAKQTRKSLARQETQAVRCLRYVVILVLLGTAIGVSVATFLYSRGVERESFERDFEGVSAMTLRSFAEAFEHKLAAMDVLSAGVTSHAISSGEVFPNVTIPDWEVKAGQLRTQVDGIYAFWLPLVTDEDRAGYEEYSRMMQMQLLSSYMAEEGMRQYQDFIFGIQKEETEAADAAAEEATAEEEQKLEQQQHQHQGEDGEDHDHRILHVAPPEIHPQIHDRIWGLTEYDGDWSKPEGSGPFLATWQLSPIIPLPALVNYNFLDYFDLAPMLHQALDTGTATLSYLQTNHSGSNTADLIRIFMTLNQYRHANVSYQEDPMTQVAYPVFNTLNPMNRNVSGLVTTTIFWRLLFADILPESVQGVVCVLSNTLGDSVTYQINGRDVIFLGTGDQHDTNYDDMVYWRDISDYLKERAGPRTRSYTSVPLDTGYTSYSIHVYPSQTMEDTYITGDPIVYAVVVASIFVFTSFCFLLYDCIVERRQAKVMDKAVKSTAVVTSLFPEAVHERLFADANSGEVSKEFSKEMETWKASSREFAGEGEPTVADLMRSSTNSMNGGGPAAPRRGRKKGKGKPIADKFKDTTVLFADLAGFTKWSSTREPEEVFVLLETLYGAFDKIALKRQVFKVETIGDCYMAVTGLPNPQADHAVRMAKFARDCMIRMQRLVEELSANLGEDTKELGFRVGLHSGPVTAGVLRGDKGRFQLFGDTVNTASRMESNGVKGMIHASESTAKLLPERWLREREDKIVAKGKGEMTTYFVEVGMGSRSSVNSRTTTSYRYGATGPHTNEADDDSIIQDIMDHHEGRRLSMSSVGQSSAAVHRRYSGGSHQNSHHDYGEPVQRQRLSFLPEEAPKLGLGASLMAAGQSLADKLGITDEIEV